MEEVEEGLVNDRDRDGWNGGIEQGSSAPGAGDEMDVEEGASIPRLAETYEEEGVC